MKNIPEKCFERQAPIFAFNFIQLNAWHSKGRHVTTALEKECITFSCFLQSDTVLSPPRGHKAYARTSLHQGDSAFQEANPLICNDAEFARKKAHEKGALPELLVEYFLSVLSPKPAQAKLQWQDSLVLLIRPKFTGLKMQTLSKMK